MNIRTPVVLTMKRDGQAGDVPTVVASMRLTFLGE
jgi:hypothetical protein